MSEQRSSLEAAWKEAGARLAAIRGCLLPEHFGDVPAEYRAVREACGVIDRTDRAHVQVTGEEAKDFLHRMLSNDIAALQPGQGRYATLLNAQGQMLADAYVFDRAGSLLLETDHTAKNRLCQTLEGYIIAEDVTLDDHSDRLAALSIEGPASGRLLRAAGAASLPAGELDHLEAQLGEAPVQLVRLSETGEEGYRVLFPVEHAQSLWDALAGKRADVPWQPVGYAALNVLRTEAGMPWYGFDMDEKTLPPEAGLEARAISYHKGCYVGQEIIERIRSRGHVNRRLAGLRLRGDSLPAAGTALQKDGKNAGRLTTVVESPGLGEAIALGYVRREYLAPGTRLSVQPVGEAEVTALPFVRPK